MFFAVGVLVLLDGCTTADGMLDGSGSVPEGMATDVRSWRGMLN